MEKIILIGGAPTIGKTHTARKLAEYIKVPWISTDNIRDLMKRIVREEDYPKLFRFSKTTPEEHLVKYSASDIVKHQNEESEEVWKGIKAFIDADYVWESFIIEGVAILPHLVSKLKNTDKEIKIIFLIDNDKERMRKTIFTRGLWDDAETYSDDVKEKEVEWATLFNKYILDEAKKHNFPIIDIGNRKEYLEKVKNILK